MCYGRKGGLSPFGKGDLSPFGKGGSRPEGDLDFKSFRTDLKLSTITAFAAANRRKLANLLRKGFAGRRGEAALLRRRAPPNVA
jgi:hypothetical protein